MRTRTRRRRQIAIHVAATVFGIAFLTAIASGAEFDTALVRSLTASGVGFLLAPVLSAPILDALARDREALEKARSEEEVA